VTCVDVPETECRPVARRFPHLLGMSYESVLDRSYGLMTVEARRACSDRYGREVDLSVCWQAAADWSTGGVCMVFARYIGDDDRYPDFVQVGGDQPARFVEFNRLPPCV
jgi:hypothetical protein